MIGRFEQDKERKHCEQHARDTTWPWSDAKLPQIDKNNHNDHKSTETVTKQDAKLQKNHYNDPKVLQWDAKLQKRPNSCWSQHENGKYCSNTKNESANQSEFAVLYGIVNNMGWVLVLLAPLRQSTC